MSTARREKPPTLAAVARISLSPNRGHDRDDYRARATRATFPSDWTIQDLQGRKPKMYLVMMASRCGACAKRRNRPMAQLAEASRVSSKTLADVEKR
jgi:hypothetical protein